MQLIFKTSNDRRTLEACSIYVAKRLAVDSGSTEQFAANAGVPIGVVLKDMKLPVVDFVRELRFFVLGLEVYFNSSSAKMRESIEEKLQVKQIELNLLYLCTLRSKYRSVVRALFKTETSTDDVVRFGWLLFVLAKSKLFSSGPSMSDQIFLFVAMLEVLIANAPVSYIRSFDQPPIIRDIPLVMLRNDEGNIDTFASLCAYHKASQADVLPVMNNLVNVLKDLLPDATKNESYSINNMSFAAPRFEGMLDKDLAASRLNILENAYTAVMMSTCELDERVFDGENVLLGDLKTLTPMHAGARGVVDKKSVQKQPKIGLSPHEIVMTPPAKSGATVMPRTPVSETMAASQWLRREVEQIDETACPQLCEVLNYIGNKAIDILDKRIRDLVRLTFPDPNSSRRCLEATKLYWKWLDLMVKAERDRGASMESLKKALSSQTFHCSVLACAIELIVASYKIPELVFPTVPNRLQLQVFELTKVIGSFVRAEDGLPRELKRHLNSLEERILESLAWQRGSSLYKELQIVYSKTQTIIDEGDTKDLEKSSTVHEENVSHPESQHGRLTSAFQAFNSPVKPIKSAKDSSTRNDSLLPTCFGKIEEKDSLEKVTGPEAALRLFFKKVSMLASKRLADLCDQLRVPEDLKQQIYGIVIKVLYEHSNLLYNRHLDQIILCSIYGVCKTQQDVGLQKQFKEIISVYKKNPSRPQEVFRSVVVSQSNPSLEVTKKGTVIEFYNKVFMPVMKDPLLSLRDEVKAEADTAPDTNVATSPLRGSTQKAQGTDCKTPPRFAEVLSSPSRVQKGLNVYVSPMRNSRLGDITPRTRSLIAFVGESASAFKTPGRELDELSKDLRCRPVSMKLDYDQYAAQGNPAGNGSIYWKNTSQTNGNGNAAASVKRIRMSANASD